MGGGATLPLVMGGGSVEAADPLSCMASHWVWLTTLPLVMGGGSVEAADPLPCMASHWLWLR